MTACSRLKQKQESMQVLKKAGVDQAESVVKKKWQEIVCALTMDAHCGRWQNSTEFFAGRDGHSPAAVTAVLPRKSGHLPLGFSGIVERRSNRARQTQSHLLFFRVFMKGDKSQIETGWRPLLMKSPKSNTNKTNVKNCDRFAKSEETTSLSLSWRKRMELTLHSTTSGSV